MRFGELTIVCRCVNRNFCNGRGEITRSKNNRLTFKKDSRGFLVSPLHICMNCPPKGFVGVNMFNLL